MTETQEKLSAVALIGLLGASFWFLAWGVRAVAEAMVSPLTVDTLDSVQGAAE